MNSIQLSKDAHVVDLKFQWKRNFGSNLTHIAFFIISPKFWEASTDNKDMWNIYEI